MTPREIRALAHQLSVRCPDLRQQINVLAKQAEGTAVPTAAPARMQYVEVTRPGGKREIMEAAEYQRLSATDLAHTGLRYLSAAEVREHLGLSRVD